MKKLIMTFDDFVNESYIINESDDKGKITPIGDTGISLVTMTTKKDDDNWGWSIPDSGSNSKPYIVLWDNSIDFTAKLNNKHSNVQILDFSSSDLNHRGAYFYKEIDHAKPRDEQEKPTWIAATKTPDMKNCIEILEQITAALYGEFQVKKENVAKLVKAMVILSVKNKEDLAENPVFNTIILNINKINKIKDSYDLVTSNLGKDKTRYTVEIFDGIKLGMKA